MLIGILLSPSCTIATVQLLHILLEYTFLMGHTQLAFDKESFRQVTRNPMVLLAHNVKLGDYSII